MHQFFQPGSLPRYRPRAASQAPAPSVGAALSTYLVARLGLREVSFAEPPTLRLRVHDDHRPRRDHGVQYRGRV